MRGSRSVLNTSDLSSFGFLFSQRASRMRGSFLPTIASPSRSKPLSRDCPYRHRDDPAAGSELPKAYRRARPVSRVSASPDRLNIQCNREVPILYHQDRKYSRSARGLVRDWRNSIARIRNSIPRSRTRSQGPGTRSQGLGTELRSPETHRDDAQLNCSDPKSVGITRDSIATTSSSIATSRSRLGMTPSLIAMS